MKNSRKMSRMIQKVQIVDILELLNVPTSNFAAFIYSMSTSCNITFGLQCMRMRLLGKSQFRQMILIKINQDLRCTTKSRSCDNLERRWNIHRAKRVIVCAGTIKWGWHRTRVALRNYNSTKVVKWWWCRLKCDVSSALTDDLYHFNSSLLFQMLRILLYFFPPSRDILAKT